MGTESITFSAGTLNMLFTWLSRLALAGRESRERTRFLHLCADRVREMEKARVELAKTYARKDESGHPMQIAGKNGGHFDIAEEKYVEFVQELQKILNEQITFDILPSNIENWKKIKEIVLNTTEVFGEADAEWYEEVCGILEQSKI